MKQDPPSLLGAMQPGAAPISRRPGARRLLEDCWTPIRNAIEPRFADILLETLGPLARADDETDAKAAKRILANDKAFLQAFSEALQGEFRQAVADFCAHRTPGQPAGAGGLSLVDYGDMEFSTLMERVGARLRNAADEEFNSLKLRLANLVREPEVRDGENPFRPLVFFRAIYLGLERIGIDKADLLRLTKRFDAALIAPVAAAFVAADRHLEAQGIGADAPRTTIMPPTMGGPGAAFANSIVGALQNTRGRGRPTVGPFATTGMHLVPGLNAEQVLQALYQRMQLVAAAPSLGVPAVPSAAPGGGARYLPAAPVGAGPWLAPAAAPAFPMVGGAPQPEGVLVDPAVFAALSEAQHLGAAAAVATPQGQGVGIDPGLLRAQVADKATRQVDKLTIEIVGMLFERIDQDKHVPPPIKELLQRLQFPMIRVALIDPEVFVSPQQPARELLDRIAATSIGWMAQGEQNERYLAEVQRAVGTVVGSTEQSLEPFRLALEQFEQYLAEESTRDDDPVGRARRALEEAETREVLAINATIKIRKAFEGVMLESYLRDFLLDTWVRVLVAANLREANQPGLMRHYMSLVPTLVWTVQPKVNPDDQQRLARKVPAVLNALRAGLALIEWPQAKQQEFFTRLMNSHAQAVKALELAHGAAPAFVPSTLSIKLDGITMSADEPAPVPEGGELPVSDDVVRQVLANNRLQVNHVTVAQEMAPGEDAELDRRIAAFGRGDWFDLKNDATVERVQLRWLSPRRAIYLFATAQGDRIHSLKPATLRTLLREGRLAPVESEHIFERALRETMDVLQRAADETPAEVA
jgi:hypothetical protein